MTTNITLKGAQERIEDFMRAGGQAPEFAGPHIPRAGVALRRLHMLREEVNELEEAFRNDDIVEVADALADIIVVALGGAVETDIDLTPIMLEVLRSNDTKINWDRELPWVVRADGKIGKDENFEPARLAVIIRQQIRAAQ